MPEYHAGPRNGCGIVSDLQLERAVREGIGHDGRILDKTMPYWNLRYLTDEDLASIIVFLRKHSELCTTRCRNGSGPKGMNF